MIYNEHQKEYRIAKALFKLFYIYNLDVVLSWGDVVDYKINIVSKICNNPKKIIDEIIFEYKKYISDLEENHVVDAIEKMIACKIGIKHPNKDVVGLFEDIEVIDDGDGAIAILLRKNNSDIDLKQDFVLIYPNES